MARGEHAIKTIKIFRCLMERNHLGISVEELMELFKVSRRSAYRYLEFIELSGVELKKHKQNGKVYWRMPKH